MVLSSVIQEVPRSQAREKIITQREQPLGPLEIVSHKGGSSIGSAFYWLRCESEESCALLMPSAYLTQCSQGTALPLASGRPSGCRRCLVACPPVFMGLLTFLSLQRSLTDKDEWCGVMHTLWLQLPIFVPASTLSYT